MTTLVQTWKVLWGERLFLSQKVDHMRRSVKAEIKSIMTRLFFAVLLLFTLYTASDQPVLAEDGQPLKTLKIAQLEWCPEICPGQERPGYIVELLEAVFAGSGYTLEYTTYPWSRALSSTKGGASLAVIAPAKKEAPYLLYPEQPVGIQRACFYTRSTSGWTYEGLASLPGQRIGLPADMSLEEIHDYVMDNRDQFYFQAITGRYLQLSINMLKTGRLDAFGFTENAVIYQLRRDFAGEEAIRQAGCVSTTPVYLAFTPTDRYGALRDQVMHFFDDRVAQMRKDGTVTALMARYGLVDWSDYDE